MVKKYKFLLVIVLVAATGFLFLFARFGLNDSRAIADFSTAYQAYDKAIADESKSVLGGPVTSAVTEQKTDAALADLKAKSSARISSLTKNDGEIMRNMTDIAALATQELAALQAYKEAAADQSSDMETLGNQFRDLTSQRQSAYTRFRQLSGQ